MQKVKRFLASGLVLIMLLSMLPLNTLTAFAAEKANSGEDDIDLSESDAFDALGIDTSDIPADVDLNSTDNPYGRNTFIQNPVYEVIVQDAEHGSLFGHNKPLGLRPIDVIIGANKDENDHILEIPDEYKSGVVKTVAGHFNNNKDAKKSNFVTVAINGEGNKAGAYL